MASYSDLYNLITDSSLRNKIRVAVVVAAEAIRNEDVGTANHANRLVWAASVFQDPKGESDRMFWAVIAANKDASVATIQGASDAAIQTQVNAAVDLFATG